MSLLFSACFVAVKENENEGGCQIESNGIDITIQLERLQWWMKKPLKPASSQPRKMLFALGKDFVGSFFFFGEATSGV